MRLMVQEQRVHRTVDVVSGTLNSLSRTALLAVCISSADFVDLQGRSRAPFIFLIDYSLILVHFVDYLD